ncbi:type II secretion system protein [Candidatus Daviesbacteria bacterium]|nr:type II secretion system protein [Candidatus Daviesbacteria bacterium]
MKKLLPKSANNPKGFTLIELLVVITIIAILATVGVISYTNVQKRARDDRRIQDVNQIIAAWLTNTPAGGQPGALDATWFANGQVPTDPMTGQMKCGTNNTATCKYCLRTNADFCSAPDEDGNGGDTEVIDEMNPTVPLTVCANMENDIKTGTAITRYYCKSI